jgi:hypothetical protein
MYTAEPCENPELGEVGQDWAILDPDGDWIFTVGDLVQAGAAISHLNRTAE